MKSHPLKLLSTSEFMSKIEHEEFNRVYKKRQLLCALLFKLEVKMKSFALLEYLYLLFSGSSGYHNER